MNMSTGFGVRGGLSFLSREILTVVCDSLRTLWDKLHPMKVLVFSFMMVFSISGCGVLPAVTTTEEARAHDAVLAEGDVVEFRTPNGVGRIIYVSEFVRRYEIGGDSYEVTLVQRDEEFMHRAGIYNPGESWGPLWMRSAPRFVVDESVVRFSKMEEAVTFFRYGADTTKYVSSESGLVLGYEETPGRYQVNVSLYKCYVNGKLMKSMPKQFRYPGYVRLHKNLSQSP